jgi:hypothetical protein
MPKVNSAGRTDDKYKAATKLTFLAVLEHVQGCRPSTAYHDAATFCVPRVNPNLASEIGILWGE